MPSGMDFSDPPSGPECLGEAILLLTRTKGAGVPGDAFLHLFIHSCVQCLSSSGSELRVGESHPQHVGTGTGVCDGAGLPLLVPVDGAGGCESRIKPLSPLPCSRSGQPEGLGMGLSQADILMKDKERKKLENDADVSDQLKGSLS